MSVALLDRRRQRPLDGALWEEGRAWSEETRPHAGTEHAGPPEVERHGALTLDELIAGIWEGLVVDEVVRCPACRGRMTARAAIQGEKAGGGCLDCGAQLS
jgi:hypothetical protein